MTDAPANHVRRLPVGAEVVEKGGVHFRVWAPASQQVAVVLGEGEALEGAAELALKKANRPRPGWPFAARR